MDEETKQCITNACMALEMSMDARYESRMELLERQVGQMQITLAGLNEEALRVMAVIEASPKETVFLEKIANGLETIEGHFLKTQGKLTELQRKLDQMRCFFEQHKHPDGKSITEQMMDKLPKREAKDDG